MNSRTARGVLLTSLVLTTLSMTPRQCLGHELPVGRGTQSVFRFLEGRMEIELNYGMSAPFALELKATTIDVNHDGQISAAERDAWLEQTGPTLLPALDIRLNGQRIEPQIASSRDAGIIGPILNLACDAFFILECPLPDQLEGGGYWLHYRDGNFEGEGNTTTYCWVSWKGHAPGTNFVIFDPIPDDSFGDYRTVGRSLTLFFDNAHHPDIVPPAYTPPTPDELLEQTRQREATADVSTAEVSNAETSPSGEGEPLSGAGPSSETPMDVKPLDWATWIERYALAGAAGLVLLGLGVALLRRKS